MKKVSFPRNFVVTLNFRDDLNSFDTQTIRWVDSTAAGTNWQLIVCRVSVWKTGTPFMYSTGAGTSQPPTCAPLCSPCTIYIEMICVGALLVLTYITATWISTQVSLRGTRISAQTPIDHSWQCRSALNSTFQSLTRECIFPLWDFSIRSIMKAVERKKVEPWDVQSILSDAALIHINQKCWWLR